MAKRKNSSGSYNNPIPTLGKNVPHIIAYTVLVLLFLAAVKLVKIVVGVDY